MLFVDTDDDNIEAQDSKKKNCFRCYPNHKEKLGDTIKKITKSYERKGYLYILIGLSLNIPWIYLLYTTSENVAYSRK